MSFGFPVLALALSLSNLPENAPTDRGGAANQSRWTDLGYARITINRDIRFVTEDSGLGEAIRVMGRESAHDLPRKLDIRRRASPTIVCEHCRRGNR